MGRRELVYNATFERILTVLSWDAAACLDGLALSFRTKARSEAEVSIVLSDREGDAGICRTMSPLVPVYASSSIKEIMSLNVSPMVSRRSTVRVKAGFNCGVKGEVLDAHVCVVGKRSPRE